MKTTALLRRGLAAAAVVLCPLAASAADTAGASAVTGRHVYETFRAGLAEPSCPATPSRWMRQYAHAPQKLASRGDATLSTFAHVVESLRAANLPTEYALIPFVESGYNPAARSPAGPAGLWQMIGSTARNHKVPMRAGYDGRMSPVDSTRAAVRYLKTLHGMFGGNWRLAVMAYNVGEYRVIGALRRSGQSPRTARAELLEGLPEITRVYDDKLHAISCVFAQADAKPQWLAAIDRPVQRLAPVAGPTTWVAMETRATQPKALRSVQEAPAVPAPSVVAAGSAIAALGQATESPASSAAAVTPLTAVSAVATTPAAAVASTASAEPASARRHTVVAGESLWRIARRYGVSVSQLLSLNSLDGGRLLAPGMVLAIDSALAARK
ncbi:lytic transglycosylase domain-containing protein [Lysobacter humi (ex Lee et al. 2017)]